MKKYHLIIAPIFLLKFFSISSGAVDILTTGAVDIEDSLLQTLINGETSNIIVTMKLSSKDMLDRLLNTYTNASGYNYSTLVTNATDGTGIVWRYNASIPRLDGTGDERATFIVDYLEAYTYGDQSEILNVLREGGFSFEVFWISNQIFVRDADYELVIQLSTHSEIESIREELIADLGDFEEYESDEDENIELQSIEWNLEKVSADQTWAKGIRGEGIIVGSIDSGVRVSHESLRKNYVGEYGWFDPESKDDTPQTLPSDENGHGTHTMGIIVGSGVGVAPAAKWMACRACRITCPENSLLACGQFMACPSYPDGSNRDCSKRPHLVSNSWGRSSHSEKKNKYFDSIITMWKALGIIPIFAAGNSGPNCGTVQAPGNNPEVISVGATDDRDRIYRRSSMGPSFISGAIKPDVSAPGVGIRSASHQSDSEYTRMSGTSMACPHIAGAVALLLSVDKNRKDIQQISQALTKGADVDLIPTGQNCGGVLESIFPNNAFGFGRVNINSALSILMNRPLETVPTDLPRLPTRLPNPTPQINQPVNDNRKQCSFQNHFNLFTNFKILEALANIFRCKILFLTGNL